MRRGTVAIAIALVLSAGPAQAVSPKTLAEVAELVTEYGKYVGVGVASNAVYDYLKQMWSGKPVRPTDQAIRIETLTQRMSEDRQFLQLHHISDADLQDLLRRVGTPPTHTYDLVK